MEKKYNKNIKAFYREDRVALFNIDNLERIYVDNETFDKLKSGKFSTLSEFEINELINKGFIIDTNKEVKNLPKRKKERKMKCDYIRLVITQNCNLQCQYCFVDKESKCFSKSDIVQLGKFIKHDCEKNVEIQFFGGEPLLYFNIIKKCVQYLSDVCKEFNISYIITTNGTLINREIATFFKKYDFSVFVSIDGDKEIHNSYRKNKYGIGSYNDVIKGVEFLKKQQVNIRALITYNAYNRNKLDFVVKHISNEIGIKQLAINTPQPSETGWKIDGKEFSKDLIRAIREARRCGGKLYSIADKIFYSLSTKQIQYNSCSRARDNYSVTIIPDFKLSFCNVCWNEDILCDKCQNVSEYISDWKNKKYKDNVDRCTNCVAKNICTGKCPIEKYYYNKGEGLASSEDQKCVFFREFIKWAIWI